MEMIVFLTETETKLNQKKKKIFLWTSAIVSVD